MDDHFDQYYLKAIFYLKFRQRSVKEIEDYLKKKKTPEEMIARVVTLGEKIPDALSDIVKEARADGLTEPVFDTMLDGISARCTAIAKEYGATAAPAP